SKVTSEWEGNKNNHPIQHYKNNHSFTPPWMVVKGLYFGTTINWYKVLPQEIKKNIAQDYFKHTNLQDSDNQREFLVMMLKLLREYRNDMAHGSRTFLSNVSCELSKNLLLSAVSPEILTEEELQKGMGQKDLIAVIV